MPADPLPIVLVQIDQNSRLSIYRHEGVQVAFLDLRVDPVVVLMPEANQMLEMAAALERAGAHPIVSPSSDDELRTAAHIVSMLESGGVVVATGPAS